MRSFLILGIILIALGIFSIGYDYYPKIERHSVGVGHVEIGSFETEKESSPVPLIIGIVAIAAGCILIIMRRKK
ncbi:MAG TPA: hypothetical protein VLG44_03875 [Chlamydiales bacterium]|nr:hypothetical protein [Chlamydiales bacterium]